MRSGFTLTEILVGILVLGITVAVVVPKFLHLYVVSNSYVTCGDITYPHSRLVTGNGGSYIKDDRAGAIIALPPGRWCKQIYAK